MSKKGPIFERVIAKKLSLWWTANLAEPRDDVFWRTHSSGARATSRSKQGKRLDGQYGDLCATDPIGKPFIDFFTVSLKRGYDRYTLDALFTKPDNKGGYGVFIKEAIREYAKAGSQSWLLIVKRDFQETIVVLEEPLFGELIERFPIGNMTIRFPINGKFMTIWVYLFKDFLKYAQPSGTERSNVSARVGLDRRTLQLMHDLFNDKKCCKCGQPAGRFINSNRNTEPVDIFYCHDCLPANVHRFKPPLLVTTGKDRSPEGDR